MTCWLGAGADAATGAAVGAAATGAPGTGAAGAAAPGRLPPGTGVGAGAAAVEAAPGVATRAGGPNIDGWPLWRFHDSQMKNSEARKMPQSRVRRMSVMTSDRKTRALRARAAHAPTGR